jgi:hypothetical protein
LGKLGQEADAHLVKAVLPRSEISDIREQLVTSGIDEVTIFPDLDGLGRFLMTLLQAETQSR